MVISAHPAKLNGTRGFTYMVPNGRTENWCVTGFYASPISLVPHGNCFFLPVPGHSLSIVDDPSVYSRYTMMDITLGLKPVELVRVDERSYGAIDYGDYEVVVVESLKEFWDAVENVSPENRPVRSEDLVLRLAELSKLYPDCRFVIPCFSGGFIPRRAVAYTYVPHDDDNLFLPGYSSSERGQLPLPGRFCQRGMKAAFSIEGLELPVPIKYSGFEIPPAMLPSSVAGFFDNRPDGPDHDYIVPRILLEEGLSGEELLSQSELVG